MQHIKTKFLQRDCYSRQPQPDVVLKNVRNSPHKSLNESEWEILHQPFLQCFVVLMKLLPSCVVSVTRRRSAGSGAHGRPCVPTSSSNDCPLCLALFKAGAVSQAFAHAGLWVSVTVSILVMSWQLCSCWGFLWAGTLGVWLVLY